MDPQGHILPRGHSIPSDDLDLQPVRETRIRILNDIPREPEAPCPNPRFNFVNVSFPKSPNKTSQASSIDKIKSIKKSSSKSAGRSTASQGVDAPLEGSRKLQDGKPKNELQNPQGVAEADRRQFISQLLRKGIPVWEEVPRSEISTRYVGKVPSAVWEDVVEASAGDAHFLLPGENIMGRGIMSHGQKADVRSSLTPSSSFIEPLTSHPIREKDQIPGVRSISSISPHVDGQGKPLQTDYSNSHYLQNSASVTQPNNNFSSQTLPTNEQVNDAQGEQERSLRILKRKFGGRLVDDNSAIDVRSWRVGAKAAREKFKPQMQDKLNRKVEDKEEQHEEEEKHEKEATKETPRKRDLSAPSQLSDQPLKRHQKLQGRDEIPDNNLSKSPVRVRNYDVEEVRKFMLKKRRVRTQSQKELKQLEEFNQIAKGERLKELASKSKELACVNKKAENAEVLPSRGTLSQTFNKADDEPQKLPNWGCPSDCLHDGPSSSGLPNELQKEVNVNLSMNAEGSKKKHSDKKKENTTTQWDYGVYLDKQSTDDRHKSKEEKMNRKQRRKDEKKKRRKHSLSNVSSASLSDLVSRTVEECDRQLRSSSISLSSITTPTSQEVSDREVQSSLSSEDSTVNSFTRQRVVALDQMAQNLESKIDEEEENLKHFVLSGKQKEASANILYPWSENLKGKSSKISEASAAGVTHSRGQFARVSPDNLKGKGSKISQASAAGVTYSRGQFAQADTVKKSVPYSEIEMLSVEELKARMTAMLMPVSSKNQKSDVNVDEEEPESRKPHVRQSWEQHNDIGVQTTSTHKDIIPSLSVPETPKLQLSSGSKFLIVTDDTTKKTKLDKPILDIHEYDEYQRTDGASQEKLSELPGNNLEYWFNKSGFVAPQFQHDADARNSYFHLYSHDPSTRVEIERAAICIQSAYRGYRVRKITSSLLKKSTQNIPDSLNSYKFSRLDSSRITNLSNQNVQTVDWRRIREDLEKDIFMSGRELGDDTFQRSNLPEWVKPYMVLCESGDVNEFIKSGKHIDKDFNALDRKRKQNVSLLPAENVCEKEASMSDSDKENIEEFYESEVNATLIEGRISDLDETEIVDVSEKGTQTTSRKKLKERKVYVKAGGKGADAETADRRMKTNENKFVNKMSNKKNYKKMEGVDLKRRYPRDTSVLLNSGQSITEKILLHKSSPAVLPVSGNNHNETSKVSLVDVTSGHNETLEEGPIEDLEEKEITAEESMTEVSRYNFEVLQPVDSSEVLELTDVSRDTNSEVITTPHKLLGSGPHFGPANLRLRLNAELMYQDTMDEALNQLRGVEQLQILERNNELAVNQSFLSQQEEKAHQKLREEQKQKELEEEKKRELKEFKRKEFEMQQKALSTVERIEKEAKERLDQLERDVRARAEQIMIASQRPAEHNSTQPDVIATAAVAAVGATISQWERLRQVHGGQLESPNALTDSQRSASSGTQSQAISNVSSRIHSKISRSRSYSSSKKGSASSELYTSVSERISISQDTSKSSVMEELSPVNQSSAGSSVEEFVQSEVESVRSSASEVVKTSRSYKAVSSDSEIQEVENLTSVIMSGNRSVSESIRTSLSKSKETNGRSNPTQERLSRSKKKSPAPFFKKDRISSSNVSDVVSEIDLEAGRSSSKTNEITIPSEIDMKNNTHSSKPSKGSIASEIEFQNDRYSSKSNGSAISSEINTKSDRYSSRQTESSIPSEIESKGGKSNSNGSGRSVPSEVIESIKSSRETTGRSSTIEESVPFTVPSASASKSEESPEYVQESQSIKESVVNSRDTTGSMSGGKSLVKNSLRDSSSVVAYNYSESFEVESGSDSSYTSAAVSQRKSERDFKGDLSLVVSGASNILATVDQSRYKGTSSVARNFGGGMVERGSNTALGLTLNVVESLQKEEEVRLQHQTALLKLQEQSLIEEARWKLAALQSEGGPGLRRRQRAVLLQLKEQRTHLRRLIEAQNLAAQQRRLLLLQHHHLLATTSSISSTANKGYPTSSRGHSPSPASPRLTPRMMEVSISSSSDCQDDMSLRLSPKSRETASSSLSDSSSREKRRSHSDERKRIASARLQEKRRGLEADSMQKEKEIMKTKRKMDMVTKRNRDKREKSPITPMRAKENSLSTESSVPEESIYASTHESQSSVAEEAGSESVSQSDVASSVSEHEGSNLRNEPSYSVPSEFIGSAKSSSVEESLKNSHTYLSSNSTSNQVQKTDPKSEIEVKSYKSQMTSDSNSVIKTASTEGPASQETDKTSSIQTLLSEKLSGQVDKSEQAVSESVEVKTQSLESQSTLQTSDSSERHNKSKVSGKDSGDERSPDTRSRLTSKSISQIFDVRSNDSKSGDAKSSQRSSARSLPLPLRVPLSPRSPHRQRRRYSSESDDSFTLSQTETASDMSDGEGKLLALKEQLASRRAEAEKLRKEKRRMRRERVASQEQALRQQIANYDNYIQQTKVELERESKELLHASQVKPLIKKPQVAESRKLKHSESILTSPEKSDISDLSVVSESSRSDHSVSSKSHEGRSDLTLSSKLKIRKPDCSLLSKVQEVDVKSHSQILLKNSLADKRAALLDTEVMNQDSVAISQDSTKLPLVILPSNKEEDVESSKESLASVSEEYSFEEESNSDHSGSKSIKNSLSRDSSPDTDQSPSQASSTETIVHSPKKLDSGHKDCEDLIQPDSAILASKETIQEAKDNEKSTSQVSKDGQVDVSESNNEVEKKLEIFIPTTHMKSEADESSYQDKDTSIEESFGEEIAEDIPSELIQKDSEYDVSPENIFSEKIDKDFPLDKVEIGEVRLSIPLNKEEIGEISLSTEKDLDTLSKLDSLKDLECSEAPLYVPDAKDSKASNEDIPEGPSLTRQTQVDDISNCIFLSLMKETTTLFTTIIKGKESSLEEAPQSTCDLLDPLSDVSQSTPSENLRLDQSYSSNQEREKETDRTKLKERSEDFSKCNSDGDSSSKSQVLKRVNDLIAESSLSPRSTTLSSPRAVGLQLTPQLTFDISPDSLSPVSPLSASPSKASRDAEKAKLPDADITAPEHKSSVLDHDQSQGASPSHDIAKAEDYNLDMEIEGEDFAIDPDALTSKLLNLVSADDIDLDSTLDQIKGDTEFSVEGIEGNWFDDDFWASSDTRKKQQQLKAEEERLAAEIARLEELQQLQEQFPDLVIREVPNKPPPPYTPPGSVGSSVPSSSSNSAATSSPTQPPAYRPPSPEKEDPGEIQSSSGPLSIPHRLSKADLRKLATEIFHVVPSSQEEVMPVVEESLECLCKALEMGINPSTVEPPSKFMPSANSSQGDDISEDEEESCTRIFSHMVFTLTRELVSEVYDLQNASEPPPWMNRVLLPSHMLMVVHRKSHETLKTYTCDRVKVLFGWKPPPEKESLMIRWARKHRDLVDQVLVKELQAEEASWTRYDEDESSVKLQMATEIFEDLINETVDLFFGIIAKKVSFR